MFNINKMGEWRKQGYDPFYKLILLLVEAANAAVAHYNKNMNKFFFVFYNNNLNYCYYYSICITIINKSVNYLYEIKTPRKYIQTKTNV